MAYLSTSDPNLWPPSGGSGGGAPGLIHIETQDAGGSAFTPAKTTISAGYRQIRVLISGTSNGSGGGVSLFLGTSGGAIDTTGGNYLSTNMQGLPNHNYWSDAQNTARTLTNLYFSTAHSGFTQIDLLTPSTSGVTYAATRTYSKGSGNGYTIVLHGYYSISGVVTSLQVVLEAAAGSLVGEVSVWGLK